RFDLGRQTKLPTVPIVVFKDDIVTDLRIYVELFVAEVFAELERYLKLGRTLANAEVGITCRAGDLRVERNLPADPFVFFEEAIFVTDQQIADSPMVFLIGFID